MHQAIKFLALVAAVNASPFVARQGVTSAVAPKDPSPAGCMKNYNGKFGMVIVRAKNGKRDLPVSQISDGQVQAPSGHPAGSPTGSLYPQPPQASPPAGSACGRHPPGSPPAGSVYPQPPSGSPPAGSACGQPPPGSPPAGPEYPQPPSGQPPVGSPYPYPSPIPPPQVPTYPAGSVPSVPHPPQVTGNHPGVVTVTVTCEHPNGPCSHPTQESTHSVTQIADGQPQNHDQRDVPMHLTITSTVYPSMPVGSEHAYPTVSQISDGQAQVPSHPAGEPSVSQIPDGQAQAPSAHPKLMERNVLLDNLSINKTLDARACPEGLLVMTLRDGVLTDSHARTGYIASNYQFQFDSPPQAGALITAGYSICSDGYIAQGAQKTFYQCKSGDFYNLYDHNWAAQCEPIHMKAYVMKC